MIDYESINRTNWDERAPLHAASKSYNVKEFATNPSYISDGLCFDIPLLGGISGLDCVHLQCHIGTDTLSLSRLGAASVAGLDFSSASLKEARALAAATHGSGGEKLRFVEAPVYQALDVLPRESFDLVFTGIGALCWLPRVRPWASAVAGLLKPGGRLFIREGHPIVWAMDGERRDGLIVDLPYFEHAEPVFWDDENTYVDTGGRKLTASKTASFNHGMGEIIEALISEGLFITGLMEHQSVPWIAFPGQMKELGGGEYGLIDRPSRLPLSYTLQAVKK